MPGQTMPECSSLEQHPNAREIRGITAQLPHISDDELRRLADAWHNTVPLADARAAALTTDSPLIVDVLAAFESVQAIFADDVRGADFTSVDRNAALVALKAIRDAVAAAYARPIIAPAEHELLMRAWRSVFPHTSLVQPDLGPAAATVRDVLGLMETLSARCHDVKTAALYDRLVQTAWAVDADLHAGARTQTWQAAILTSRRRIWTMVRRTGSEGLFRSCRSCPPQRRTLDDRRVLELCLDAACALLVTDVVDVVLTEMLTLPVSALIPGQRAPID